MLRGVEVGVGDGPAVGTVVWVGVGVPGVLGGGGAVGVAVAGGGALPSAVPNDTFNTGRCRSFQSPVSEVTKYLPL